MALVVYDRVQETTATTGTGSITLGGAVDGFQSFAIVGNGNTTYYCIVNGLQWEVGLGTYSTSGPTLARTTVYSNSNGNTTPITLSGASNVFLTYPSERSVNLDASGNVTALGTVTSGVWNGTTVPVAYGGTGVTASSGANSVMLRDANQNVAINRLNQGTTTVTAAGGTTTLSVGSTFSWVLNGTGGQTFKLPDATTLTATTAFEFNNNATGTLTITDNANAVVGTVASGGAASISLLTNVTVAGLWDVHAYIPENVTWGTNALNLNTTVITNGTWNGGTIQSGYGGTGLTTFTAANNALYSTSSSALAAGTLPVAAGGTAKTSFTANQVLYGSLSQSANLSFDGTNLGIGVASPVQALQVSKGASGIIASFTNQTSADLQIDLTAGVTLLTPSTSILAFGTANTERMRLNSTGLGIGVSNPLARLQVTGVNSYAGGGLLLGSAGAVSGYISTTDNLYIKPNTSANTGSGSVAIQNISEVTKFYFDTNTGNAGFGTTNVVTRLTLANPDDTTNGQLRYARSVDPTYYWETGRDNQLTGDFIFSNAAGGAKTERMRISAAGSVGIGTNNPTNILSVEAVNPTPVFKATSTGTTYLHLVNDGGVFYVGRDSSTGVAFGKGYANILWGSGAYPIVFATSNAEKMRLTSTGGLSFGASETNWGSSGQLLQSNGNASPSWVNQSSITAGSASNVAGLVQNAYTTYGNLASTTAKNTYYGMLLGTTTSNLTLMADGSGNGGFYKENTGAWPFYYLAAHGGVGIMSSTTESGIAMLVNGIGKATSDFRAPIFYDSDNTAYYLNPLGTSQLNQVLGNDMLGSINSMPRYTAGAVSGMGISTDWDPRPGPTYDRYSINWHTGISLSGYPSYGGVRLYSASYPTLAGSTLRLEASTGVYTYGTFTNDNRVDAPIFYDYNNTAYYGDFAGTSNLNVLNIANGINNSDWYYSYNQRGMYNNTYAGHFYQYAGQQWVMAFGGNTDGCLALRQSYNGTVKIQLYYDTSGSGLLNNTGNWGVRMNYGSANAGGTLYGEWVINSGAFAPIYYDSADSSYFLDPNGTSNLTNVIVGYNGSPPYATASNGSLSFGTGGDPTYRIGTQLENVGGNYTKLTIDWHTGIRIGAYPSYGGTRFYNNAVAGGGSKIFSVGEGDSNVRVTYTLYATTAQATNMYSTVYYDSDNTGYYIDGSGTSNVNTLSSYQINSYNINSSSRYENTQDTGVGNIGQIRLVGQIGTNWYNIIMTRPGVADSAIFFASDSWSPNANAATLWLGNMSWTGRSLNAGGSINQYGADYAEYMTKAGDFTIAKGDVCGIDVNGKITNVFADAISFVVKSTKPGLVGGDAWGNEEALGTPVVMYPIQADGETDESFAQKLAQYAIDKPIFDAKFEAARAKVDRISFCGQVPVNVEGAVSGQYIVAVNDNGAIKGVAVNEDDLTMSQYIKAVGKVIKVVDGKPTIIVKVS